MNNHSHHYLFFDKKFFHRFRKNSLFGAYLDTALLYLGMSLVGIFIPIYILELTNSILTVFKFYAFYHFLAVVLIFPAAFLLRKIGVDKTSFLGAISRALFLLFLILAKQNTCFLWLAFLFLALTIPLCWLPFHYTVVNIDGGDKKFGKESGILGMITRIFSSLGPILGGFIISFFGFSWLYFAAIIIVLLSGISLFLDRFEKKGMEISIKQILKKCLEPKLSGVYNGLIGMSIHSMVYGIAWPIFIFLAIGSYKKLGIITSSALFISLIVFYWAGQWVDKKGKGILKIGAVINSLNWLLRPFLKTAMPIFLSDSIYLIGSILIWTPFEAAFYEKGLDENFDFIIIRELIIHFSAFLACLLLGLLFWLKVSWFWIFSLAIFGLWLTTFIIKKENDEKKNLVNAVNWPNSS